MHVLLHIVPLLALHPRQLLCEGRVVKVAEDPFVEKSEPGSLVGVVCHHCSFSSCPDSAAVRWLWQCVQRVSAGCSAVVAPAAGRSFIVACTHCTHHIHKITNGKCSIRTLFTNEFVHTRTK